MKSRGVLLMLAVLGAAPGAYAQTSSPPAGWSNNFSTSGNTQTWSPGTGPVTSASEGVFAVAATGGVKVTSSVAPVLANGLKVPLTVVRTLLGSDLALSAGAFLGTPLGMVASAAGVAYMLSKIPGFGDWLKMDGGQNVRLGPVTGQLEKKIQLPGDTNCVINGHQFVTIAECVAYGVTAYFTEANTVYLNPRYQGGYFAFEYYTSSNGPDWTYHANATAISIVTVTPPTDRWDPASMNDIAPYMSARPPPSTYPEQILYAGGSIPIAPDQTAITGPASLPSAPPFVRRIEYPAGPDRTSTTTASGNPFNLPDSTPVDEVSTVSIMTGPGSITTTGDPLGYNAMAPASISIPATVTTTRTYNPATGTTTSGVHTVPHSGLVTETTATAGTVTVNGSSVAVTTSRSTSSVAIDPVTGLAIPGVVGAVITDGVSSPGGTSATDCQMFPGSVGCAPMGVINDSVLPAPPVLYVAKFADGLAGVWTANKTALFNTPLFSVVSQLMPAGFSGGACPVWQLPLAIGPWDYGSSDVAPPCWLWGVAKAIIVISALLLARSLIFGG